MELDALKRQVAEKRAALAAVRPMRPDALDDFERVHDLELTFTSNAIEGNTLSALETALVVEKGITIGGKPLRDHMEAIDHAEAIGFVRALSRRDAALTVGTIRELHALVLKRSQPDMAWRYAESGRYVLTDSGARHAFPSPAEIPPLMGDLGDRMRDMEDSAEAAFDLHRGLVDIHPFADGNGRTARLLMNLVLLRGGHPPIAIRPEDRLAYLRGLQAAQAGGGTEAFDGLMFARLDATLDDYLAAIG